MFIIVNVLDKIRDVQWNYEIAKCDLKLNCEKKTCLAHVWI